MKQNDSIIKSIIKNEKSYLKSNFNEKTLNNKKSEIVQLRDKLKSEKKLRKKDIILIRNLAINKCGFLSFEHRVYFYNKVINYIHDSNSLNLVKVSTGRYKNELSNDTMRSILFTIFEDQFYLNKNCGIIKKIINDILENSNILFDYNNNLDYYQGFNEVIFYFIIIIIFMKSHKISNANFVYKFTQSHFNIFINKHFKLDFSSCLDILDKVIEKIDYKLSREISSLNSEMQHHYALSWIITWFTHKNTNFFSQFRLIDYLIVSPPETIFYVVAIVILDEYKKIIKNIKNNQIEEVVYFYLILVGVYFSSLQEF